MFKMKKISIAVFFACSSFLLQAQDVKFGLKGGLNLSNVSISGGNSISNPETNGRTSFHVGGLAEIKLADEIALQPEIQYTSVGYKFKMSGIEQGYPYTADIEDKIDYLAVPVMFKYFPAEGFSIEFGPQIAFLMSHKADIQVNVAGTSNSETTDLKKYSENTEFGLNFGASYKLKNNLFFSGRYNLGLSDMQSESSDGEKILNRCFQLSIGYFFKK